MVAEYRWFGNALIFPIIIMLQFFPIMLRNVRCLNKLIDYNDPVQTLQGAATPMYPVLAVATGIKFTRYYGYTVENGNAVVVHGRTRKYTILIVLNQFLIG